MENDEIMDTFEDSSLDSTGIAKPSSVGSNKSSLNANIEMALRKKISLPVSIEILSCEMGYGVFATKIIEDGEVIEEAPVIILPSRNKDAAEQAGVASLLPFLHVLACNCKECQTRGQRLLLSSGYIQMYNHSKDPNARLLQHNMDKRIMTVEALKEIPAGEQIFINYGDHYPERWLLPQGGHDD